MRLPGFQQPLPAAILPAAILVIFAVASAPAAEPRQTDGAWKSLFDGKSLGPWKSTNFGGEGEVAVKDGVIQMEMGSPLTGVTLTGKPPEGSYEIEWEARRLKGIDFFAALTFPVGKSYCSFIVGGWAGAIVGISSIDNRDASENETTVFENFKNDRWYKFRVRVTPQRIICWIDKTRYVNVKVAGRKISTRTEVDLSQPLGISAYESQAQVRNIRWRTLSDQEVKAHNADEALDEPDTAKEKDKE